MAIVYDCKVVSPLDDIDIQKVSVHMLNGNVYKVYPIKLMIEKASLQQRFFYEFSITKQAKELEMQHIIPLKCIAI